MPAKKVVINSQNVDRIRAFCHAVWRVHRWPARDDVVLLFLLGEASVVVACSDALCVTGALQDHGHLRSR